MRLITVTDLVLNFAEACKALLPSLGRAGVAWREGQQYDNWDRIAEPLFHSLVTEPCAFHAVGELRLPDLRIARYGFAPSPEWNDCIVVEATRGGRMIDLTTVVEPFDHVRCATFGALPLRECEFAFVFQAEDGTIHKLSAVDLDAE